MDYVYSCECVTNHIYGSREVVRDLYTWFVTHLFTWHMSISVLRMCVSYVCAWLVCLCAYTYTHTHTHTVDQRHQCHSVTHLCHELYLWVTMCDTGVNQRQLCRRVAQLPHSCRVCACDSFVYAHIHVHTHTHTYTPTQSISLPYLTGVAWVDESCHTHTQWAASVCHAYEWLCDVTRAYMWYESCHADTWVMSHIWIRHVTQMNESCRTHTQRVASACHTYRWVMWHTNTVSSISVSHKW